MRLGRDVIYVNEISFAKANVTHGHRLSKLKKKIVTYFYFPVGLSYFAVDLCRRRYSVIRKRCIDYIERMRL